MSPLECEFLFRCYYDPNARPDGDLEETFCDYLVRIGAIKQVGDVHGVTPLGNAWVHAILKTPVPRLAYIGHDGKEITHDRPPQICPWP